MKSKAPLFVSLSPIFHLRAIFKVVSSKSSPLRLSVMYTPIFNFLSVLSDSVFILSIL